ncbi:MAG: DUF3169 family protein [Lachnospiraceae bacterium]
MKNKENSETNNKKIYITFIVVMVVLYGAGYMVGRLVAKGEKSGSLDSILNDVISRLTAAVPPLYLVLAVASLIVVCALFLSCKKMHQKLQNNPEDDDLWDTLEEKMNFPMILCNIMQIANILFFTCIIYIAEFNFYGKNGGYETVIIIADCVLFFVVLAAGMLIPKGIVDIEKQLNPEKQGNVFDFKFNEVWLASCDEAQKMMAYKAAYKAFKDTNITCIVVCILAFIGMFVFKTGIYPILCVCVIWMVNNVSYMLRAAKLERRK